jgi:hypothetical protein
MLRIVINNQDIEYLNQFDIGLSLSKRAIDPAQPFARLGSRSYTVKFPATNINNRIFNNGNHTQTINKFRQYTCTVYDGSTLLISGVFKLQNITRDTYEGYIVSDNVGFKDLISDKSIQDLDLGSFRFVGHKKDDEPEGVTLRETWFPEEFDYWDTMWLPLISYGNYFKSGEFDRYAKIDELTFEDFTPNFSYTNIFRKIFEEAGYTVSGELIDNVDLKDLMFTFQGDKVPWNWELLTNIIIDNSQVFDTSFTDVGTFGTSSNPLIANKRRYYLQDVNETKDHLSKYDNANVVSNPVGQEWFCPREGTYEFTFNISTQQHVITTGGDDANALEQAKHNKICLVNVDGGDTSDENSDLFTRTTTPYANTTTPIGSAIYELSNNIDLAVGETKTVIYDLAQGGALDGQYNPVTGEYTAANDETILLDAQIYNQPINIEVKAFINGLPANIQPQGLNYIVPITAQNQPDLANARIEEVSPFTYFYPTRDVAGVPPSEIPQIGFGREFPAHEETPFQLQAGDVFTFTVTNNGTTPHTITPADTNGFALTARSLVDRAVPIFELNDRVKAYLEPWKDVSESNEEKVGGSPSSDFYPVDITYSNSGYTDNGGGNYTYDTDISYTFQVSCEKGELIKIMMLTYNDNNLVNDYNCTTVNNFTWAIVDGSGEDFIIANALPAISQIDYITDALRTFNLFYNIDESNKTISFVKRAKYFRNSNPLDLPFSLHDRQFTQSKAPRTLYLGLYQLDNDGYGDQLEGLRKVDANPFADRDKVFQFSSQFFAQAFKRLYTIEGEPRDSLQFEIPTLSPNNSTNTFRNDVDELNTNTQPRLVFRGNGASVYAQHLQGIGGSTILIDEFPVSQLPISRVDNFVSFKDGNTIFGEYWNDDFLYQATDVLTIKVAMTSGQYNQIDLRRSVVIENNTYIIQEISGFNPLNPQNVTLKLLRL